MTDPQRLLSSISDADDLERELLASIQNVEPPSGAKGEAWSKLSAQIAAVGLVSAAHGSAAAGTSGAAAAPGASAAGAAVGWAPAALHVLGGKLVLGLAVAGVAIGASALWVHNHRETPPTPAPAKSVVASSLPPLAAPAEPSIAAPAELLPAPVPTPTPTPTPEAPVRPSTEQARKDRLSAESALLTKARAELRRGDAATAQQTLDQLRVKFPQGVLGQEREVLSIEVLAARGNTDAARRRARAFIAAYPKSPHSAQLARFTEAP